ncbi:MAG: hypothetical protein KKI12_01495 [Proteobacteria bacterium]|nr:hypothetical protein [Pseudomonadota bacterium]MBU4286830.1 hypothetical protein [Pseudomonadota bacterium]MBU4414830.1 hypothetical protein [Pseudomonadota bacterium]MCG2759242.1 hypothetical protein [Desulfobacteraceae bacterium]
MSLLKKLFGKKQQSEPKSRTDEDLPKYTQYFESLDEDQIKSLEKLSDKLKKHQSNKAEAIQEFMDAGLDHNKIKKAERIVNEYGQAILEATELNKRKVKEFGEKVDTSSAKALQDKKAIYYHLMNKFDIRLLPYDKNTIKEAIELLLENETDENRIEQLRTGLLYLDDFIDLSDLE